MFKRMLSSKTFWTGIASIGTGVGLILGGDMNAGIPAIIIGVQTIFIRDAISKLPK